MGRVVLGVSASISAYKVLHIARRLMEWDVEVRMVLTRRAERYFLPKSLAEGILRGPVYVSLWERDSETGLPPHIALARWLDLLVIVPCSAGVLGRLAQGYAPDLLSTLFLAVSPEKVLIFPAMETAMWEHPVTQANVRRLQQIGVKIFPPEEGSLASGETGIGRLPEPETVVEEILMYLPESGTLQGIRILISAGAPREYLDRVRFLSNASSGRMGIALVREALRRGASVDLLWFPSAQWWKGEHTRLRKIPVESVEDAVGYVRQCLDAVSEGEGPPWHVYIGAGALSDFVPVKRDRERKWSRRHLRATNSGEEVLTIHLRPAPSLLELLDQWNRGRPEGQRIRLIAFAHEPERSPAESLKKFSGLSSVELVVYNQPTSEHPIVGEDTIRMQLLNLRGEKDVQRKSSGLFVISKETAAKQILDAVEELLGLRGLDGSSDHRSGGC